MIFVGILRHDSVFGGTGSINDAVDAEGTGVARKVVLLDRANQRPIRSTWSAPDGSYSFTYLRTDRDFIVYAFDHTNTYNIAIKDRVRAA